MNSEAINLLKRAGLNQYESKVYLALLNHGKSSASQISDHASIPRPRAYDVLSKLEKKGFVTLQPGRPTKFTSLEIDEAFNSLSKHKERKHLKKLNEIQEIGEKLKKHVKTPSDINTKNSKDSVWILSNRPNIYSKLETLINNAERSIIISSNENEIKRKLEMYGDALIKAKERGVDVKTVCKDCDIQHDFEHKKVDSHRMMIADDHVVLFLTPEETKSKDTGAWIKSPYLADNLRKMIR